MSDWLSEVRAEAARMREAREARMESARLEARDLYAAYLEVRTGERLGGVVAVTERPSAVVLPFGRRRG